jgi:AAHS family 4-hydroxybenzoate transporter-like MFS transporter
MVIRVLAGLGLGGARPCFIALTSEYSPARLRAALVTLMRSAFPLGGLLDPTRCFGQIIGPLIPGVLLGAGWTAGPIMTVTACGGLIGAVFVVLFSVWLSRRRVEGLSDASPRGQELRGGD